MISSSPRPVSRSLNPYSERERRASTASARMERPSRCLNPYSEGERRATEKVSVRPTRLLCLNPYSEGERRALLIISQLNIIGQQRQ